MFCYVITEHTSDWQIIMQRLWCYSKILYIYMYIYIYIYRIKIVNLWILLEFTVIIDGFSKDFKSGLQDFKVVADPSANVELFA